MLIVLLTEGKPVVVEMQLLSETKILWKEKKVSVGLSSAIR